MSLLYYIVPFLNTLQTVVGTQGVIDVFNACKRKTALRPELPSSGEGKMFLAGQIVASLDC